MDGLSRKKTEALLIILVLALVIIGFQFVKMSALTRQIERMSIEIEGQSRLLSDLRVKLEDMESEGETGGQVETPGEDAYEQELPMFWVVNDYPKTPEALLSDLRDHAELIPFEGVLGGTPFFVVEESRVIDEKYVYGFIEDGHIMGGMILRYGFNDDGSVTWTVIDGWWPSQE